MAGKADWSAAGLPMERAEPVILAGDVARSEVPTCGLSDKAGDVLEPLQASGWDECIVVNDQRIVLGRVKTAALDANIEGLIEEVMDPGPSTFRPDVPLEEILAYFRDHEMESAPITTPEGQLRGVLRRSDAEGADPRP